ncbi:hypothetical protein M0R72_19370 [Candidatus Pacearchaeota archaeon]|nr:hypothetical protein [Candidatus Pacearchaeota archaeon]
MTKLFFLRPCPIWTTVIPAQSVQDLPEWIAKKLINGGVAIEESTHQERIAERAKRKAEEKAKADEEAKKLEESKKAGGIPKTPDEPKAEKKVKKGGKE